MESREEARERLLALAQGIDFARRYYALVGATRESEPCHDLPADEIRTALEVTGRSFRYNRRERFFATREKGTPGELGLNLTIDGVVEFILVVEAPAGHIGDNFPSLARDLIYRYGPPPADDPRWPRVRYRNAQELQQVLAEGLTLYSDLAAAVLSRPMLGKAAKG
jgi:hypothetical protein